MAVDAVDHRARLKALEDEDPRAHLLFDTPYCALAHAARERPDEPAYRFLRYGGPDEAPEDARQDHDRARPLLCVQSNFQGSSG